MIADQKFLASTGEIRRNNTRRRWGEISRKNLQREKDDWCVLPVFFLVVNDKRTSAKWLSYASLPRILFSYLFCVSTARHDDEQI